jgi:hypothetical protein
MQPSVIRAIKSSWQVQLGAPQTTRRKRRHHWLGEGGDGLGFAIMAWSTSAFAAMGIRSDHQNSLDAAPPYYCKKWRPVQAVVACSESSWLRKLFPLGQWSRPISCEMQLSASALPRRTFALPCKGRCEKGSSRVQLLPRTRPSRCT